MIYYYYGDDDDIKPTDDWYAFNYFICSGWKRPREGSDGIMIALNYDDSKKVKLDYESIKLVQDPIPSDVSKDFIRAIWSAK